MKNDAYIIEAGRSVFEFEFYSEGPRGKIKKEIAFEAMENAPLVFNLSFGDVKTDASVDDLAVTNNNDTEKVLATVAWAVYVFLNKHPKYYVYATGSTNARNRLYRMGINKNLKDIMREFEVFGLFENDWEVFTGNRNYEAFHIKKINSKFV